MREQYNVLFCSSALAGKKLCSTDSRYGETKTVIPSSNIILMSLTVASEHPHEFSSQKLTIL